MTEPMIPVESIGEGAFWASLKPLLDLIGTTPLHQYAETGMTINLRRDPETLRMHVRFQHAVEDRDAKTPWPIVPTGDGPFDELAYDVDVQVVPGPGDPISLLWPESFPEGIPANGQKAGA